MAKNLTTHDPVRPSMPTGSRVDVRLGRRLRIRTRTDTSFILAVAALVVGILMCVPPIIRAARERRS